MAALVRNAPPKPMRGSGLLASRERTATRKAHEDREMQAALRRDKALTGGCRWPRCEYRAKKLPIDPAHVFQHRGMGGNAKGDRTRRSLIMGACRIHHSLIDHDDLRVDALDQALGTDGCLAFYRRDKETGQWQHVATETRIGVSESRGA